MNIKYKKSPLIEVVCEIQFVPSSDWDITWPGLFYERIKDNFPNKKQDFVLNMGVTNIAEKIHQEFKPLSRLRFFNNSNTYLIQLMPNILTINHLEPYTSWEEYKPQIINNLNQYEKTCTPKAYKKIELRYINKIEFNEKINLNEFLNFYYKFPENLISIQFATDMRLQIPYNNNKEFLTLSLKSLTEENNKCRVILDIDYVIDNPSEIKIGDIGNWLDDAHKKIEEIFESCITDKARFRFGVE